MFSFERLLYVFVILFNFSIFLNVCIYSRDGSRFSNIRIVNLIIEYRLGYAIIF